ncbi:PadR family transcriptional regulator [Alkalihalophilus marmarensis]|uniref:Transcription regulator PadR N-terminal domain-containing protein n=1 Tax=Alkalihalophilus marmarensis DSM 21297 TaxID=1188261 RepID=U6STW5_9BACI|nr:PadR family transcriptional regulator [Alkalihalophilus marmarensis]ERN55078.1 hypothetical protein A33I_03820 [Alkalihalophilus marmarensis DSM 21297]MCM3489284.1 PadR family transcriptional regulator [Alkalihalophilus marmarensis]
MEDQFKHFKKAMDETHFKGLTFDFKNQEKVKARINQSMNEEQTKLYLLQTLQHEAKSGFEVLQHIEQMGITHFESQEGMLYQLLHQLEREQIIQGNWSSEEEKYYQLTKKGLKQLKKLQQERFSHHSHRLKKEGWV